MKPDKITYNLDSILLKYFLTHIDKKIKLKIQLTKYG